MAERRRRNKRRLTIAIERKNTKPKNETVSEEDVMDALKTMDASLIHPDLDKMRKSELLVPENIVEGWERVSEQSIAFTKMAMESSLQEMDSITDEERKAIEDIINTVEEQLRAAVAPVKNRRKNYTDLNRQLYKKMKKE